MHVAGAVCTDDVRGQRWGVTSLSHLESERERLFFKDGFYSDNCILIQ